MEGRGRPPASVRMACRHCAEPSRAESTGGLACERSRWGDLGSLGHGGHPGCAGKSRRVLSRARTVPCRGATGFGSVRWRCVGAGRGGLQRSQARYWPRLALRWAAARGLQRTIPSTLFAQGRRAYRLYCEPCFPYAPLSSHSIVLSWVTRTPGGRRGAVNLKAQDGSCWGGLDRHQRPEPSGAVTSHSSHCVRAACS